VKEYEITVVYRAHDDAEAEVIRNMLEDVLMKLDHPVTVSGSARLAPPLDPRDE
jgi:hypothetical protein